MAELIQFSRILFPTDFATSSDAALTYAISLARQLGAAVHLLHAIEPIVVEQGEEDPEVDEFLGRLETKSREQMEEVAARFRAEGIVTTQEVVVGQRWSVIVKRASQLGSDLIVMGTHGIRIDDQQVILGSTSHRVPYLAPCPVVLVRDRLAEQDDAS